MTPGRPLSGGELRLLPRDMLVTTGPVDHADWNYAGVLGAVARRRFHLALALMPGHPVDALLEIGYGSGVFMPELAARARTLFGADVHGRTGVVGSALAAAGVEARLVTAPAEVLPFPNESFDVVIAISAFEFVRDPVLAADEIARVLRPGGRAIVVTPGTSLALDLALKLLTGADARKDFGRRRDAVIPALTSRLHLERTLVFPKIGGPAVYRALQLARR